MIVIDGIVRSKRFPDKEPAIRLGDKDYCGVDSFKAAIKERFGDDQEVKLSRVTSLESTREEYIVADIKKLSEETKREVAQPTIEERLQNLEESVERIHQIAEDLSKAISMLLNTATKSLVRR